MTIPLWRSPASLTASFTVILEKRRLKLQRRRYGQAIALLRAFVALEPDAFLGHQLLATAYERTDRPTEALAEYREAARLAPDSPAPQAGMTRLRAR